MIISTTLAGPGSEATIARALESIAPHVDQCLVIETRTLEGSPSWKPAIEAVGEAKLRMANWTWRNDFGAARNAALDFAAQFGATHAATIDSDEWWTDADEIREAIAAHPTADAFEVFSNAATPYPQPRIIRLPCAQRWDGRVHEAIAVTGPKLTHARFCEVPKTREMILAKAPRDLAILLEVVKERPLEARWRYYLADAYAALEQWPQAVQEFIEAAKIPGWHEQGAWACFRAAELLTHILGRHDEAIELCCAGLSRHAGIAELPWLAAVACVRLGRLGQAVYFMRLAEVHGERGADGALALAHRKLWRSPKALREGPAEMLAQIFRDLGDKPREAAALKALESWTAPEVAW